MDVSRLYQLTLLLGLAANESCNIHVGLDDDNSSNNPRLRGLSQGVTKGKPQNGLPSKSRPSARV